MVVIVPETPPSEYKTPPPVGFVVGTIVEFPIAITLEPPPKVPALNEKLPFVSIENRVAPPVRSVISNDPVERLRNSYSLPDELVLHLKLYTVCRADYTNRSLFTNNVLNTT